ncbi:hypothetical protein G7Z17_g8534 [Cylindrodendrum hubeiense]|uniref:Uncharacterized protein n=1 Tax=Cylindrodendrum hubeiense TaxID=595255 RepID=A0A9P5H8E8_9HYPO|nr:hypothetical protein G7Z17_g8534 [Cylindrodendrum hubeiense]
MPGLATLTLVVARRGVQAWRSHTHHTAGLAMRNAKDAPHSSREWRDQAQAPAERSTTAVAHFETVAQYCNLLLGPDGASQEPVVRDARSTEASCDPGISSSAAQTSVAKPGSPGSSQAGNRSRRPTVTCSSGAAVDYSTVVPVATAPPGLAQTGNMATEQRI